MKSEIDYTFEEKNLLKSVIEDLKEEKKNLLTEKNNQIENLKENNKKLDINISKIERENKIFSEKIKEITNYNSKLLSEIDDKKIIQDDVLYVYYLI